MAAYSSYHYTLEVLSPVFIGGVKENDYTLGEDYFYKDGNYSFFKKKEVLKLFTNLQFNNYTIALASADLQSAAKIVSEVCLKHSEMVYKKLYCPFDLQDSIRKHVSSGLGQIYIPGSSIKGALRSIIGKLLMNETHQKELSDKLFGSINNNFMRLLQVSDVEMNPEGGIYPFKTYSGDVEGALNSVGNQLEYYGMGMWKHAKNGGHGVDFNERGFVTFFECLPPGSSGMLRLNWADDLQKLIHSVGSAVHNQPYLKKLEGHKWMEVARKEMNVFIDREINFYDKFYNKSFDDVFRLLDELRNENNSPNAVVLRIGQGSGFHAITGNWHYSDHTQTQQAKDRNGNFIKAVKYKTRKMVFHERDKEELEFFLPGFIKITIVNK